MYRPREPFTTAFMILNPSYKKELGKVIPVYPKEGEIIKASFKTFGGTETVVNGVWTIQETAEMETWYRPDIKSDTHLQRLEDGKIFEIVGDPEDISYRHQFLKFKVKNMRGTKGYNGEEIKV